MATYTATSRVPTRPLSYSMKELAYRKELLVDYTNGMIYIIDQDGVEHDVSEQVYNEIIQKGDEIFSRMEITVEYPDGSTDTVTLDEGICRSLIGLKEVQDNVTSINTIIEKITDGDPDDPTVSVPAANIVEDATHKFITQAQLTALNDKISIKEVTVTINPSDVSGSTAPYECTKSVSGVDPSYPRPILDISYIDNVYENNVEEEEAFYCIQRCQILTKNEAKFTFRDKPTTTFNVTFQIQVPGGII